MLGKLIVFGILATVSSAQASNVLAQHSATVQVMTDGNQRTLYTLDTDKPDLSSCEGDCLVEWPPFLVANGVGAPEESGLGVFTRTDGRNQYSFNGKPLYYFDQDQAPGDAKGSEDDGIWHVIVLAAPAAAVTPTTIALTKPAPFVLVAGCREQDYVDGTAATVIKVTAAGLTPKCLRVHAGTKVSIQGSAIHPMQGMAAVNGVANPFIAATASQTLAAKTLTAAGFYGYFCTHHGTAAGAGMAGAIQVVP